MHASVTLVFGDEPLLVEEAADSLRHEAHAAGFDERLVLTVEPGFDWGALDEAARSMSLFSSRRLIDLRMPTGKPGDQGTRALARYCDRPPDDTLLLIVAGRLDARTRKSKWFKTVEKAGRLIERKQVAVSKLPGWIVARARDRGLSMEKDAALLLSHFTEGNLLAAAQEIDKLKLLSPEQGSIGSEDVAESITDSARFSAYTLVDHCLAGDAVRAMRSLTGLRNEGVEPVLILWVLANQIRTLYRICRAIEAGQPRAQALKSFRVWSRQVALVNQALGRLDSAALASMLQDAAALDRVLKGRAQGSVWAGIERLCLAMCQIGCVKVPA
jgi:DNA polymerase-3 subunit delta